MYSVILVYCINNVQGMTVPLNSSISWVGVELDGRAKSVEIVADPLFVSAACGTNFLVKACSTCPWTSKYSSIVAKTVSMEVFGTD